MQRRKKRSWDIGGELAEGAAVLRPYMCVLDEVEAGEEVGDFEGGGVWSVGTVGAVGAMLVPRSQRMVPGVAFFGSVAPMVSRHFVMAPSASRTMAIIFPEDMKSVSSPKNGRALWTA